MHARPAAPRRTIRATAIVAACALVALAGCSKKATAPRATLPPRTFVMGFSGIPPRLDFALAITTIQLWAQRSDGAIMSDELPWDSLLAGVRPDSFVIRNQLTFTDLDLATWPAGITPFAYNGLVDIDLNPKPALAPWDSLFTRPRS